MGSWTVLARDGADTSVSRCPEGHIHLEYGTTNIRLDDRHFLALAGVVCAAARKLGESAEGCEHPAAAPFGGN
jgi:hypothetical protein